MVCFHEDLWEPFIDVIAVDCNYENFHGIVGFNNLQVECYTVYG